MTRPQTHQVAEPLPVVVEEGAAPPVRFYSDDAGLDLVVSQDVTIDPGTFCDIPCGVSAELPEWAWALITGRSSALRKRGLLIHGGIIDAGYRGPLYAGAWNLTDTPVVVLKGERVAQMILVQNATRFVEPVQVAQLSKSPRGDAGFGSTGT